VGFGGGNGPRNSGGSSKQPTQATTERVGGYKNTDAVKAYKSIVNIFNRADFDYSAFAYHFVTKAPGPVIRNFFKAFEAVSNVLIQRFDTDTWDSVEEYEAGIIAKRIEDALDGYP
jgi:hypothetical protein